jgi:hypothetical protein
MHWRSDISFVPVLPIVAAFRTFRLSGHYFYYPTVLVTLRAKITINVPVVFMARYVMVLRGATSLQGALEGVGPENRDFFGP